MQKKKFSMKKISKKMLCCGLTACVSAVCLVTSFVANAASSNNEKYEPLIVKSGFNTDVVATANGAYSDSTSREGWAYTSALDNTASLPRSKNARANACLYSRSTNYKSTGYLPDDGIIKSTATSGLYWQLADYKSKNNLRLNSYSNPEGTLEFKKIGCYKNLYVLCMAGGLGTGNSANMKVTLNYTDGSKSSSSFTVYDWWDNKSAATYIYQRMDSARGGTDGSPYGAPYFTQCKMNVDTSKLIKNITISSRGSSSGMILNVMGITGITEDLAAPTISIDSSSVTQTSFNCSWTSVSRANGYRIDVSKSPDFQSFVTGYNNKDVGNVTSLKISGLDTNTKYYVRVRAYNPYQSASSNVASTKTLDYPSYTAKINVKLDGNAYSGRTVSLCQNGTTKSVLAEGADGEYSASVKQIGSLIYDIYVDGMPTGKAMTLAGDVSQTVNFYTATVNVNLEDKGYSDRKVTILQDGVSTELKEVSTGVYKTVMREKDNNTYQVYVDGKNVSENVTLGTSASSAVANVNYYNAQVKLTLDGSGYTGRNVTLSQNGNTSYKLTENSDGVYSLIIMKKDGAADNKYNVNMDGVDIGKTVSITNVTDSKTSKAYYTGRVEVRKDNLNWEDVPVYTSDSNGKTYLKSNGSGMYTAVFEDDGTSHSIYVNGKSVNASFNDNTVHTFDYYTVTFYKKQGVEYAKYVVKENETAPTIAGPDLEGYTFDHWSTSLGSSTAYDFSTKLTSKTDLYAVSAIGKVVINGTVRCTSNGTVSSTGTSYKMPNVSITGYPRDKQIVSYVQLDGANMPSYTLSNVSGITVSDSTKSTGTNSKGEETDRIIIKFSGKITVAQAESYLRNIVITPTANEQYSMQITVYAANYQ